MTSYYLFRDCSSEKNKSAETDEQKRQNYADICQEINFCVDVKANCA